MENLKSIDNSTTSIKASYDPTSIKWSLPFKKEIYLSFQQGVQNILRVKTLNLFIFIE